MLPISFVVAASVALSLISYFVILPIQKYLFDAKGLRRYPNLCFGSGIWNTPFIFAAHRGFRSEKLRKAHINQPIIRIGPNSLSFSRAAAIRDIYGHGTKCTKDLFYSKLSGTHTHLADVIDKIDHARKRKTLSSAYAIKNLEGWEHKVADMTRRMIKAFDENCIAPPQKGQKPLREALNTDYRLWSNLYTVAAIANIGLSEDIGFLDRGSDVICSEQPNGSIKDVNFIECLFANAVSTSNLVWSYDWYRTLVKMSKILSSTYRRRWKLAKDWDGIVYNRATTRLKRYNDGEKLDDFFSALMEDKSGAPNMLEWGEIVAEIGIMMNAGSDTTAIAMSNTMYLLLKHPHILSKLREEVDAAMNDDDIVAPYDSIKHLPYLRACIDESLRVLPPVTFGLPRRTPPEGTSIAGTYVAGDTSVSMSAYVVHHNPEIFENPEIYRPERWLGEAGKQLQPNFITFSTGARGCIGRNISYLEQTVALASLIHRYDFALPYPGWEPIRRETTTLGSGPMPIQIWRRDDSSKCTSC